MSTNNLHKGTKTHKPNCGCPVCKRVRGRQEPATGEPKVGGFSSPIAVPSIAEAHELASNPKALELAQKLAKVEGELAAKQAQYNAQGTLFSNVRIERDQLKTSLRDQTARLEAKQLEVRELLDNRQAVEVTIQALKTSDLAFRAAAWSAIETLTSGACKMPQDDPRFLTTSPAEMCGLLIEAVQHARETEAIYDEFLERFKALGINEWSESPADMVTTLDNRLYDAQEARSAAEQDRDRLQAERDQWKGEAERWEAEAKRYQTSTNNLGGMVKGQARGECHGPEADLPGGILSGLPNPFRWLSRWIGGGK